MLSKCANSACSAKFRYLSEGKVFAVEHRSSAYSQTSDSSSEFEQIRRDFQFFWLCPDCSQFMTVQARGAGGVRLAPSENVLESKNHPEDLITDSNPRRGYNIVGTKSKLEVLEKELQFLDKGGYRQAMGWRPPLVFEDSPICPKPPSSACPDVRCVLLDLVPEKQRDQIIPCRHIPLNEAGETLHTLYNTASMEEIENVLREWLKRKIAKLEQGPGFEPALLETKPG